MKNTNKNLIGFALMSVINITAYAQQWSGTIPTIYTTANKVAIGGSTIKGGYASNETGFEIQSPTNGYFNIYSNVSGANSNYAGLFTSQFLGVWGLGSGYTGTNTYIPFVIYNGGSERLRIATNGNVGIGTTGTPSQKLEIAGNAKLTGTLLGTSYNQTMVATGDLNWSFGGYQSGSNFWMQATYWDTGDNLRGFRVLNMGTTDVVFSTNKQNTFIPFGNVGIGTTDTKGYKLAVNGSVVATSVTVKLYANWPDYVFMKNHKLPSILEIEEYVDKNKHLPNIPSAAEVEKSGINLAQMDAKLLEKIEELTLYIVDLQKQINTLKK